MLHFMYVECSRCPGYAETDQNIWCTLLFSKNVTNFDLIFLLNLVIHFYCSEYIKTIHVGQVLNFSCRSVKIAHLKVDNV